MIARARLLLVVLSVAAVATVGCGDNDLSAGSGSAAAPAPDAGPDDGSGDDGSGDDGSGDGGSGDDGSGDDGSGDDGSGDDGSGDDGSGDDGSGDDGSPTFVAGNPSCTELGYGTGVRIDPPVDGEYAFGDSSVTVTITDGLYVDWQAAFGPSAVFVKGGAGGNLYGYDNTVVEDVALQAPVNPVNDQPAQVSHLLVCY